MMSEEVLKKLGFVIYIDRDNKITAYVPRYRKSKLKKLLELI